MESARRDPANGVSDDVDRVGGTPVRMETVDVCGSPSRVGARGSMRFAVVNAPPPKLCEDLARAVVVGGYRARRGGDEARARVGLAESVERPVPLAAA